MRPPYFESHQAKNNMTANMAEIDRVKIDRVTA